MNNQIVIFFVGVDNSGKTHIAKELSCQLDIPYFKNTQEKVFFHDNFIDALHYHGGYLQEILDQTKLSFIKDRDYPCEYAYAHAYERDTDEDYLFELDKKYRNNNLHIVYCYKTERKEFQDHLVKSDKISNLEKYYLEFLDKTVNPVLRLDTTDEDLETQIKKIRSFINR